MEIAYWSSKGALRSITRVHHDLIVSTQAVHERKHRLAGCGVDQHVYVWQREFILRTCFVKVAKVNTTPDLSNFLLYWNNISQSGWMLNKLDEANIQELLDFFFDLYFKLWPEIPRCLFYWSKPSLMLSLCKTNCGSRLGICSYVHAKTSFSSRNRPTNDSFISCERLALMKTGLASSLRAAKFISINFLP